MGTPSRKKHFSQARLVCKACIGGSSKVRKPSTPSSRSSRHGTSSISLFLLLPFIQLTGRPGLARSQSPPFCCGHGSGRGRRFAWFLSGRRRTAALPTLSFLLSAFDSALQEQTHFSPRPPPPPFTRRGRTPSSTVCNTCTSQTVLHHFPLTSAAGSTPSLRPGTTSTWSRGTARVLGPRRMEWLHHVVRSGHEPSSTHSSASTRVDRRHAQDCAFPLAIYNQSFTATDGEKLTLSPSLYGPSTAAGFENPV